MGEGMIGERAVGVDPPVDDLGDDVRNRHVDSLERGDDRLLRRGEAGGDGRQPDIASSLGRRLVGNMAKAGEAALAAGRGGLAGGWDLLVRPPAGHLDAGVVEPVGKLSTGWNSDPDQIGAVPDEVADRGPRFADLRRGQWQADPRSRCVAEQVEQPDPLDCACRETGGLGLGRGAAAEVAEDLGLEGEIDGSRRDLEGQRLGGEVVLDERGREWENDPAREPTGTAREIASYDLTGQRPPRPIEAGNPEQSEERSFAAGGRRGSGTGTPGPGQRRCPGQESVGGTPLRDRAGSPGHRPLSRTCLPVGRRRGSRGMR